MLYQLHELQQALSIPMHRHAKCTRALFQNPFNPWSHTQLGRTISANAEMIERATRRFDRPEFGIHKTKIAGKATKAKAKPKKSTSAS